MTYQVNDGRIATWALEAHAVDHCNLRCAECCTLSPQLPDRVTAPDALFADLQRVARVLRPAIFKLTGGEPLLHPDLAALLDAARASGIAPILSVTTNGFFAPRQPDAFWERLDRMTLSLYPSAPLPASTLALIRARTSEHDVALAIKPATHFQDLTPKAPLDESAVRAIHAGCWLKVRCHLVHEGRFYTCTRPPHLNSAASDDGITLDDAPDLLGRVLDYLERDEPLAACHACLGASGVRRPHRQLPRALAVVT